MAVDANRQIQTVNSTVLVVLALKRSKPSSQDGAYWKTSRPQNQACGNSGKDTRILYRLDVLYGRTCCIYVYRLYARPWGGNQDLLRNKGIVRCVSWPVPFPPF